MKIVKYIGGSFDRLFDGVIAMVKELPTDKEGNPIQHTMERGGRDKEKAKEVIAVDHLLIINADGTTVEKMNVPAEKDKMTGKDENGKPADHPYYVPLFDTLATDTTLAGQIEDLTKENAELKGKVISLEGDKVELQKQVDSLSNSGS